MSVKQLVRIRLRKSRPTNLAVLETLLIPGNAENLLQEWFLLQVVRLVVVCEEARECVPCSLLQLGDVDVQLLEVVVLFPIRSRYEGQYVIEEPQAFCQVKLAK